MLQVVFGQSRTDAKRIELLQKTIGTVIDEGTLYFGYPVLTSADVRQRVDALLVSPKCGILGILFGTEAQTPAAQEQHITEQDGLATALESQLKQRPELRIRRNLAISVDAVTVFPGQVTWPSEGNFVSMDGLPRFLQGLPPVPSDDLYRLASSVIEHVASIRPTRKRENVKRTDSMGAKLKRMEREIANLDRWQKQAAIETPAGAQRIRGLAGSGKTVVLALKAAYLHAQQPDWRIAVIFYSQSLYAQFKDLIRRFCFEHLQDEPDWSKVCVLHAWGSSYREGFYYRVADAVGLPARNWLSAKNQYGYEKAFAGSCTELLSGMGSTKTQIPQLFDAVLIDEAQDLPTDFFRIVHEVTTSPKRIVWAYDELQQLAAESVPSAEDLFGVDSRGKPKVSLRAEVGEARRDIVLPVCYRNPPWTLSLAHALGFGTARPDGLVQHFDDPSLWQDVGYEVSDGGLNLGQKVTLKRRRDTYPQFFEEELTQDDSVGVHVFNSDAEQIQWVAQSIKSRLLTEELEASDFLIVLPDDITSKSRANTLIGALAQRGQRAHHVGVHTERDVVFQDNSIAISHIYRAKGNEAAVVYIVDAEYGDVRDRSGLGLASRRNKLFTAMTRSRAWLEICGVGDGMEAIKAEVEKVRTDDFNLEFTVPTLENLRRMKQLHRDRDPEEQKRLTRMQHNYQEIQRALAAGEIAAEDLGITTDAQKLPLDRGK